MNRTFGSAISATVQVAILAVGPPLWAITRVREPLLPTQTADLAILLSLVLWVLLAKATIERSDPIDPSSVSRHSLQAVLHRLVDRSWLGAATATDNITETNVASAQLSELIARPTELSADELPQQIPLGQLDRNLRYGTHTDDRASASEHQQGNGRLTPTLRVDEPERLVILATETYIVGRGDTYWSIAEATLGDGRQWTAIQELNLGREVAPGLILDTTHELRIGWSVLVPLTTSDEHEE